MEITIKKSEIFKEVEKRTSLEGISIPDRFEEIWATEYEGGYLNTYWIGGCTSIVQIFKRYLKEVSYKYDLADYDSEEVFSLNAEMSSRYSDVLTHSVEGDMKMMIACNVMWGWMQVKQPELASKYENEAKEYAGNLKLKLLYRDSPSSKIGEKKEEDSKDIDTDTGCMSIKEEDSEFIAISSDESLVIKGMDHLKLTQYENCNNSTEQRRNYGGCGKCRPCDR